MRPSLRPSDVVYFSDGVIYFSNGVIYFSNGLRYFSKLKKGFSNKNGVPEDENTHRKVAFPFHMYKRSFVLDHFYSKIDDFCAAKDT